MSPEDLLNLVSTVNSKPSKIVTVFSSPLDDDTVDADVSVEDYSYFDAPAVVVVDCSADQTTVTVTVTATGIRKKTTCMETINSIQQLELRNCQIDASQLLHILSPQSKNYTKIRCLKLVSCHILFHPFDKIRCCYLSSDQHQHQHHQHQLQHQHHDHDHDHAQQRQQQLQDCLSTAYVELAQQIINNVKEFYISWEIGNRCELLSHDHFNPITSLSDDEKRFVQAFVISFDSTTSSSCSTYSSSSSKNTSIAPTSELTYASIPYENIQLELLVHQSKSKSSSTTTSSSSKKSREVRMNSFNGILPTSFVQMTKILSSIAEFQFQYSIVCADTYRRLIHALTCQTTLKRLKFISWIPLGSQPFVDLIPLFSHSTHTSSSLTTTRTTLEDLELEYQKEGIRIESSILIDFIQNASTLRHLRLRRCQILFNITSSYDFFRFFISGASKLVSFECILEEHWYYQRNSSQPREQSSPSAIKLFSNAIETCGGSSFSICTVTKEVKCIMPELRTIHTMLDCINSTCYANDSTLDSVNIGLCTSFYHDDIVTTHDQQLLTQVYKQISKLNCIKLKFSMEYNPKFIIAIKNNLNFVNIIHTNVIQKEIQNQIDNICQRNRTIQLLTTTPSKIQDYLLPTLFAYVSEHLHLVVDDDDDDDDDEEEGMHRGTISESFRFFILYNQSKLFAANTFWTNNTYYRSI